METRGGLARSWSEGDMQQIVSENLAGTGFTLRQDIIEGCPPCYKKGLLRQVIAGTHASRHRVTTGCIRNNIESNNSHIYYWLTGLNREDSPKTCPHGTGPTPKIRLENKTTRGEEEINSKGIQKFWEKS